MRKFFEFSISVAVIALICTAIAYLLALAGHGFYNVVTLLWFMNTLVLPTAGAMAAAFGDQRQRAIAVIMFLFTFVPIIVVIVQYVGWGYIWRPFM